MICYLFGRNKKIKEGFPRNPRIAQLNQQTLRAGLKELEGRARLIHEENFNCDNMHENVFSMRMR